MSYEVKAIDDAKSYYEYRQLCSNLLRVPIRNLCDEEGFMSTGHWISEDPDFIRLGSFDSGKVYAGVNFPWFMVNYDGNVLKMYGAGGVVSDFNQPYKGAVKQIFSRAFELMKEKGSYISHLFPFADNYYRQFGYEVSCEKALWEVPINAFKRYDDSYFVPFDNSDKMKNEIKEIYRSFAAKRNMSVIRSEKDWDKFFEDHKAYMGNSYTFVSYTDEGADGYMCLSVKRNENRPPDFYAESLCFKTWKGLRGLLSYFATQTVYMGKVFLKLAADVDIAPLMDSCIGNENRHTHRKVTNAGLTRVVCVEELLKVSRFNGEGRAVIKIVNDTYCPWNNGCFTVSFGETTTVTRGGEPDIEMDINAFSAGIMGRFDADTLTIFPTVKIYGNEENLRKVFYRKLSWIEEHY